MNEEDCDVPAMVPPMRYEAAEQEKFEAQKAEQIPSQERESTVIIQQVRKEQKV